MSFAGRLRVLYEDNHLLVVDKPSGWPSAHADGDTDTVDRLAKDYLRDKYQKPGNVFLGVVHRLDKPVSGCLMFARTSKAAARLSEQFRGGAVEKEYWAVAEPAAAAPPWPDAGTLTDFLAHDDAAHRVVVTKSGAAGGKLSKLFFEVRARHAGLLWLVLRPQTGRKHQLRVQLASRGTPIYADAKYGSPHTLGHAIALHARQVTILHPTRAVPLTLTAPVPKHWRGRFAELLRGVPAEAADDLG